MPQPAIRVNPSEEAIRLGPVSVRFLLTGENSNGSMSVFEVFVPAGQIHRFEDFSSDFVVWVVFYGPEGGE